MLEWIFRHPLREQSIAIFGRDSDLLLEGLVIPPSWAHNVFIIREEGPVDYLCVSLWETTRTLWNEWLLPQSSSSPSSPNFANQILQIRTDLVLLMILNGNDYLPKLRGARGFSHICNTYMGLLRSTNTTNAPAGMVHPDKLEFHLDFCISFFQEIVKSQPPELWNTSEVQTNNTDINKKTPLGELNNIMDGGFVPRPLRFRVLKKRTGAIDEDEEEYDGLQGVEGSEHFEDEEEEKEESHRDDDEADEEDDEADDDDDDQEDRDKVLVQLTLGVAGTDYCSQYELWHGKGEPFKAAKQKLAAMALDDFLGTDYSNADGFDVESGITTSGYSWEIAQAVEGKVDRFLGGLLWNLQTYQDGLCADYHYNYGKRMSPTPTEIMEFFQQAKAENRTVGRRELLATSFGKPVSAGLSCLAALPSQVKHLVPEPYSWLPDDRVEQFYEQCMDPTDNFFDLKQFEQLCEDEIDKIQKQRYDGNEVSTVAEKKNNFEEDGHGRRIIMGDHYWTVIGRTTEPLTHPFEPPKPPGDRLSTLWPNNRIRTSRMLVLGSPRPRSVWGDKPLAPDERKRIQHSKHVGCEIIHSDLGNFLKGKKSLLDVEYKVGYRNKIAAMTNKNKGKMEFQSLKVELKIPPVDQDTIDQETVDISSRMQEFNKTMPLMEPLVNLDSQTAMACSQQLCDIGIIGAIKFEMTTPSKSDYASHDPITYEHLHLTVRKATESGILQADLVYDQDRDVHKQSRQAMKQHLVSRALDDIVGPSYRWHELSFVDLSRLLMERVPVTGKEERRTKAAAAPKKKKIDVKRRLKQFNKVEPPTSPVLNLDNQTALTCLKQLGDIGMIGQMKFTTTAPSRSEYASYNPSNYEHYHLLIPQGPGDNSNEILYKDLEYDQDRDIKTGNRQVMRQHLASLALCDITGSQRRWSEMSFEDLRDFLMEKAKNTSLKQPLN